MAEEQKEETKFSMDEEAMERLLTEAQFVRQGRNIAVQIDGKEWHIRPTSQAQNQLMADLDFDIMHWQKRIKTAETAKEAKRLNAKIRKAYARKAAHKVLGMWLRWVPFLYAVMWRRIYHSSEAVSATINATEAIGENKVFYLANLGSSKQALVLSMNQVGEAVSQRTLRGESAESMAEADGLPKKEDSKSGAQSKVPRTTRK